MSAPRQPARWPRGRTVALLALLLWSALPGCRRPEPAADEGSGSTPPPAAAPAPAAPAADGSADSAPPSPVTLRRVATYEVEKTASAYAVKADGAVAIAAGPELWTWPPPTGEEIGAPVRQPSGGQIVKLVWLGDRLLGLDGEKGAVRNFDAAGRSARVDTPLEGEGRDLWVDAAHGRLWTLARRVEQGRVVVFGLGPDGATVGAPLHRFELAGLPTGFYVNDDASRVALPLYTGKAVRFATVEPPALGPGVSLGLRVSDGAWTGPTTSLWIQSTATEAREVRWDDEGSGSSPVPLPEMWTTVRRVAGETYAFGGSEGVLRRLDAPRRKVVATSRAVRMAGAMARLGDTLLVVDSSGRRTIAALEATTLQTRGLLETECRGAAITAQQGGIYLYCPLERRVVWIALVPPATSPAPR